MQKITVVQAFELIDQAANENRLYHYNGGQAYIRLSMDLNVLMIIDHTSNNVTVEVRDGSQYFESCRDYNWSHSKTLREHGSMVTWYITNYPERINA